MNKLRQRLLNRKSDKGFTLIELVIVVVIVGILTAIAIPSYGAIQGTAKQRAVTAAAKDQFISAQAMLASGKTIDTSWSVSGNSQIAISTHASSGTKPISDTNLYVQAVWLKTPPVNGYVDGDNMDSRYMRTVTVFENYRSDY